MNQKRIKSHFKLIKELQVKTLKRNQKRYGVKQFVSVVGARIRPNAGHHKIPGTLLALVGRVSLFWLAIPGQILRCLRHAQNCPGITPKKRYLPKAPKGAGYFSNTNAIDR